MKTFKQLESNVRNYIRVFPTIFDVAKNEYIYDIDQNKYLDFFCAAGSLNYGHNNPLLSKSLIDFLEQSLVVNSLDMGTRVKQEFIEAFNTIILKPRGYKYKFQFTGPTGTNAVEAAIKLARKFTGRSNVVSFEGCFHGSTIGSISLSASRSRRASSGVDLKDTAIIPFGHSAEMAKTSLKCLNNYIHNITASKDLPAAFILEIIQCEGGVRKANKAWLEQLFEIASEINALVIIDDIQAGCGRTGDFFSFETLNVHPDIVCLSKSLSGFGLPMSIILIKPSVDVWQPGEHDGTFRGNNLAFVTAKKSLEYWKADDFKKTIFKHSKFIENELRKIQSSMPLKVREIRGAGYLWGIELSKNYDAAELVNIAFSNGLLIELAEKSTNTIKLLPPLTANHSSLVEGINILNSSIKNLQN